MLDNCTHCGSRTPLDQKDYRQIRTRKLNAILISKLEKAHKKLCHLIKVNPDLKTYLPKRSVWDDVKFKVGLYKGLIKHKLDLY